MTPLAIQTPVSITRDRRDIDLLIRRSTFGPDGAIDERARELGWARFVEEQLHPETIDDSALERRIACDFPDLSLSAKESFDLFDAPVTKLRAGCLLRAVHSKRQLFERVVACWNDHFSIDPTVGECRVLKTIEDRDAIRVHALGRFRDLLDCVTKSGAMMEYLDNRRNRGVAPNENFARELLELHTLGVGAFRERDVQEVARCFTGWSIRAHHEQEFGEFAFDAAEHDDGEKAVLGLTIPAHGGERDGQIVLDLLARHPATARRIARRLCSQFIGEDAPSSIVESVACVFEESDGDLRAVLRAVLQRENFAAVASDRSAAERAAFEDSAAFAPPKFLRPFHLVVAILRATHASIAHPAGLLDELSNLGDAPFLWPTPDGAPDRRDWWESALMSRWSFVERYMTNAVPGVTFDIQSLLANATRSDVVQRVDQGLSGGRLSAADRAALEQHANSLAVAGPITDVNTLRRLLTLAACAPSFQEV